MLTVDEIITRFHEQEKKDTLPFPWEPCLSTRECSLLVAEIERLREHSSRLSAAHNPEVCVDVQEYAESLKAKLKPLIGIQAAAEALVFERDESYPIFETTEWLLLVQLLEAARAQEQADG